MTSLSAPRSFGRRLLACAAVLMAVAASPCAATTLVLPQGVPPGDRVLLIGLDQYQNSRLNLAPNSSTKDSRDIHRMAVQAMGFKEEQILELFNEQASKANILRAIDEWLIAGSKPGSRVIFQYSGHGDQIPDDNGDEADALDEVLVPWDTRIEPNSVPKNLVIDDELDVRMSRLRDRDVLVLIDSCHSGTVTRDLSIGLVNAEEEAQLSRHARLDEKAGLSGTSRGGDATLSGRAKQDSFLARDGDIRVWSAVAATEVALVDVSTNPKQGVFTRRLMEAVVDGRADANGNGIISNAEVLNYVRSASDKYCMANPSCAGRKRSLTPTLETSAAWLGRDFRNGKTAPDTAGAVTDTLGQGASGSAGTPAAQPATAAVSAKRALRLSILPGDTVALGKEVVFEVASPINGYLAVLDINAAGQVTQIFPNEFSQKSGNQITDKRSLRLPEPNYGFAFEAQPPTGQGMLVAVVVSQAVDLSDIMPASRGFGPVERPMVAVGDIVKRVVKSLEDRFAGQSVQFHYATRAYTISP